MSSSDYAEIPGFREKMTRRAFKALCHQLGRSFEAVRRWIDPSAETPPAKVSADGPTYRPRKPPVEIPAWRVESGKLGPKPIKAEVEARIAARNAARLGRKIEKWAARAKLPAYEG